MSVNLIASTDKISAGSYNLFSRGRYAMFKATLVWVGVLCIIFAHEGAHSARSPVSVQENEVGQESPGGGGGARPEPHVEEGRVKIKLATQEMTIAQVNKVPLDLHGYAVSRIVAQSKLSGDWQLIREPEELPLQRAPDGSTYVNFVPIRLGKLELRVTVGFKDGGIDTDSVEVDVDHLPSEAPRRLILCDPAVRVDYTRKAGTLHFGLSPPSAPELVVPVAFYRGIDSPIPLNPIPGSLLGEIVLTVITRKDQQSPIALNPTTGEVKAVGIGQALIKATLRGKSAYACADVMRVSDDWNQRSDCRDFLPPDLTEPIDEPLQMPKSVEPQLH
jgi:hypothetical protein